MKSFIRFSVDQGLDKVSSQCTFSAIQAPLCVPIRHVKISIVNFMIKIPGDLKPGIFILCRKEGVLQNGKVDR